MMDALYCLHDSRAPGASLGGGGGGPPASRRPGDDPARPGGEEWRLGALPGGAGERAGEHFRCPSAGRGAGAGLLGGRAALRRTARADRPREGGGGAGGADPQAQVEVRAALKAREPLYAQAEMSVDTSRAGVDGAVEEIARKLG